MKVHAVKQDYLPIGEIRPVVELAGYVVLPEGNRYTYRNPAHHLILVERGLIECEPPGGSFVARAGDLVCFRPAERNRYNSASSTSFYQAVIEFAPPPQHKLTPMWDDAGPLPVKVSLGDAAPAMRRLFETICIELPHAGSPHQMRVRAAVFEMLAIIAELGAAGGVKATPDNPWQRMRLLLESQLAGELSVERLARQMDMSVNHFIRQFRRRFGVTPKAYHTRVRLREGARLLRDPDRSIKSIAYLLGFAGSKTFARRFRHHFGVSPSDIRDANITLPDSTPPAANTLYRVNQPVLPPYAGRDYLERYAAAGEK